MQARADRVQRFGRLIERNQLKTIFVDFSCLISTGESATKIVVNPEHTSRCEICGEVCFFMRLFDQRFFSLKSFKRIRSIIFDLKKNKDDFRIVNIGDLRFIEEFNDSISDKKHLDAKSHYVSNQEYETLGETSADSIVRNGIFEKKAVGCFAIILTANTSMEIDTSEDSKDPLSKFTVQCNDGFSEENEKIVRSILFKRPENKRPESKKSNSPKPICFSDLYAS